AAILGVEVVEHPLELANHAGIALPLVSSPLAEAPFPSLVLPLAAALDPPHPPPHQSGDDVGEADQGRLCGGPIICGCGQHPTPPSLGPRCPRPPHGGGGP